ncbi:hypothetical protein L249_4933 [Ophiocordyceps polyrhachis-furcata BCC 54312]|uniref:Postreplication repair E3 ubiquitin-protein ligase RAD18 n=1 Tax=Ophiocordyceps polyrhachis-furcata BCC 54312 TaxID=1330021 RepID=A0A367L3U2_9HYPO|nr:hypothetical protein L249_4933 [Ophiocordyceps polyrhachis-furcata BCC 54312]
MPIDNVPDPSDWLSTPLSGLAAVEASLRCQVCKDFFATPMITSCSHTFCSLCIRRALLNDGKCPLCRAPDQELKLRRNWTAEEAVNCFTSARPATLALARRKRKAEDVDDGDNGGEEVQGKEGEDDGDQSQPKKRLRTSARLSKAATAPAQSQEDFVPASDDDEDFRPDDAAADGLVPCPVCQRCMKEWRVFQHLESCPGPSTQGGSRSNDGKSSPQLRSKDKPPDRLPALNYSILKENALRKKLTELGISSQGPRALLERRHKEWLTLWNANCDATNPKKRSHLLQDLDLWERTQGGRAPVPTRLVSAAAAVKDKDFDTVAWAAKHDSSFKDLIASARKSKLEATKRPEANGSADEELSPADNTEEKKADVANSSSAQHHPSLASSSAKDGAAESRGEPQPCSTQPT